MKKFQNYNPILQIGLIVVMLCTLIAFGQWILVITIDHDKLPQILTNYDNSKPNLFAMITFVCVIGGVITYWGILWEILREMFK